MSLLVGSNIRVINYRRNIAINGKTGVILSSTRNGWHTVRIEGDRIYKLRSSSIESTDPITVTEQPVVPPVVRRRRGRPRLTQEERQERQRERRRRVIDGFTEHSIPIAVPRQIRTMIENNRDLCNILCEVYGFDQAVRIITEMVRESLVYDDDDLFGAPLLHRTLNIEQS